MRLYVVGELELLPQPLLVTTDAGRYLWFHRLFYSTSPKSM